MRQFAWKGISMAHESGGFHASHLWVPVAALIGVGVLAVIPGDLQALWLGLLGVLLLAIAVVIVEMLIRDISRTYRRSVGERFVILGALLFTTVLVFAVGYTKLGALPDQMIGVNTPIDAVYFTLATTLTVGFGDVAAVSQVARFVVIVQMIFTVLVAATAARLLVDLMRRSISKTEPPTGE